MHDSVMAFVERAVDEYDLGGMVLEVGSYDVNGTVRPLFRRTANLYLGVDIRPGPGVDRVIDPDEFYAAPAWDVIVCTEMLEHDPRPWVTLERFGRVLRRGGHLVLTARGFGPDQASHEIRCYGPHDFPNDYWRFSAAAMEAMLLDAGFTMFEVGPDTDPDAPGVFVVARR